MDNVASTIRYTREQFLKICRQPEMSDKVAIACCIALGSLEQHRVDHPNIDLSAQHFHSPMDHVYWETRENARALADKLNIFFPDILLVHKYVVIYFSESAIEKRASKYYEEVMSPTLLVLNVMES